MALVVRADVVDLRTDTPRATDSFAIDTNVWYWLTYQRASQLPKPPAYYQTRYYPNYLKAARKSCAKLYTCGTTFSELAHRIETDEHKFFCAKQCQAISLKEFRHDYPQERQGVIDEIAIAWGQVVTMAKILPLTLDDQAMAAATSLFTKVGMDGHDVLAVQAMAQNGITQVITDDRDFLTVPGIVVFTANNGSIQTAQAAGKLLTR
ncbi:MAG: type II toxin-antitoxin system VapC family toxin [Sulfuricella sp.]